MKRHKLPRPWHPVTKDEADGGSSSSAAARPACSLPYGWLRAV